MLKDLESNSLAGRPVRGRSVSHRSPAGLSPRSSRLGETTPVYGQFPFISSAQPVFEFSRQPRLLDRLSEPLTRYHE